MPTVDQRYRIASHLLSETQRPLAWSNLGYWENTNDYVIACEQLAAKVGRAANLKPGNRLLDLACGEGASIAFWRQHFGINYITALDIQTRSINNIRYYFIDQQRIDKSYFSLRVIQGSFDQTELPIGVDKHHADAIVCVDAAYHASTITAFLDFCSQALKPAGHLAFCTLVKSEQWQQASPWQKVQHEWLLKLAGIPKASVVSAFELEHHLAERGFEHIKISHMDNEVLAGFSAYIQHRATNLSFAQRLSPAWQKIVMTAKLCDFLYQNQLIHYSLIRAVKSQD